MNDQIIYFNYSLMILKFKLDIERIIFEINNKY